MSKVSDYIEAAALWVGAHPKTTIAAALGLVVVAILVF